VVGILAIVYALVMTFGGCADDLLLHPSTYPVNAGAASRKLIEVGGKRIEIFTALSRGAKVAGEPKAFVLEFCGSATRAESITQYVAGRWGDRPVEAWVMNYPGFGGSTGPTKLDSIAPAALATYDEMAREAKGKPIFLAGGSMGSVAALYVAANRPAVGMVLQNPPPLQRMILENSGWWNLWLVAGPIAMAVPGEMNSLTNAPKVKLPAVFILAGKDHTVPPKYAQMVVDAYGGEKHLMRMPGADHNDSVKGEDDVRLQKELDWLWSHLAN
jgi:hypothetical protein